jgi:hypothetical protein
MYAPQGMFLSAYTVCPEMLSKNPHAGTTPSEIHQGHRVCQSNPDKSQGLSRLGRQAPARDRNGRRAGPPEQAHGGVASHGQHLGQGATAPLLDELR